MFAMTRGLEICVLDDVNTSSLDGSGCEYFCRGPLHLDLWMVTVYGIYPWVNTLVMGNLKGCRFG
jgi:hypothetical protein